jgi:hypothetical protein
MTNVSVFNPDSIPVVFGPGRVIGGGEWAEIEEDDVRELIEDGRLIIVSAVPEPASAPAEAPVEEPAAAEDSDDESFEDTSIDDETATIKKPRRRKPQPLSDETQE